MKRKKINKYIFAFVCFLVFSFSINTNTYAALDMTEWEIDIEKDIVDDYKIKADEANVAFMKDKDSVVGDIVEHIYLESSSSSGFDSSPLDDYEFDIYRESLYESWGDLLYLYTKATGYVNGTAEILGGNTTVEGYGYNFFLDDTDASINFLNYTEWTTPQKEYYENILKPLGETLKSKFSTECIYYLTPSCSEDSNYYYFSCSLLDCNKNYISEIRTQVSKNNYNSTAATNAGNEYRAQIAQMVENNKSTIIQRAMMNFDLDTTCAKNTFIINNYNNYFATTTASHIRYGSTASEHLTISSEFYNNQLGDLQRKLKILSTTSTDIEHMINPSGTSGSWTFAAFYDIAYMNPSDNVSGYMSIASPNDSYVQARKDCLSYIIKLYNRAYSKSFISMINETSRSMSLHLKNKRYRTNSEYIEAASANGVSTHRVIYYEGATFTLSNDDGFIRTYGTSGFYFKNRCLDLSSYGISDDSLLSNDMKLDPDNTDHLNAIYSLFLSVDNPLGLQDNRQHYINLITNAKPFEIGTQPLWVQPCPFDIVFDDTRVNYTEFLTTSCIINNPLDRYEFWGQNVSNENDTTYYGESVELLPDNPNDESTKNKDGYIGEPNHIVELNPNSNWGIYLFTRYKYVNYVYKIYYGFYGANPQMIAIDTNRNTPQRIAGFYEDRPDIIFTKENDNMYGWFWKTTYSRRETNPRQRYVTEDIVIQQETLIKERIMQNVEANNDIKWLSRLEIIGPNALNNYTSFDSQNNEAYSRGDLYCYKNPVRAETIYYQVNVPFSVDSSGNRNANDYILSLGADKNETFQCEDTVTLCECDDEVGGCSTNTDELVISATVTN